MWFVNPTHDTRWKMLITDKRVMITRFELVIESKAPGISSMIGAASKTPGASNRNTSRFPDRVAVQHTSGRIAKPMVSFTSTVAASAHPAASERPRARSNTVPNSPSAMSASLWPPFTIEPATAGLRPTSASAAVLRVSRQRSQSTAAITSAATAWNATR